MGHRAEPDPRDAGLAEEPARPAVGDVAVADPDRRGVPGQLLQPHLSFAARLERAGGSAMTLFRSARRSAYRATVLFRCSFLAILLVFATR
jgi:hypothetical protein